MLYPWTRFWVPIHGRINLNDGGFLFDPEHELGKIYNPDVVKFETFKDKRCIILLGEPGIGKSNALIGQKNNIESELKTLGHNLIWINLGIYNDQSLLDQDLFRRDEFNQYLKTRNVLHVYLDGLDECKISIPQIINYLFDRFKKYYSENLYIRIACRTAVWPREAETRLREIWGDADVGIFELAPLRRKDVYTAAKEHNVNPDVFIEAVERISAAPLASRPITLDLLIKIFKENQSLPTKRSEVYFKGCLKLADENSDSRKIAKFVSQLDNKQKFKMAAQIAVVTVFGNYGAIWMGPDNEKPENSLSIDELCECLNNGNLQLPLLITRKILEAEVIDTGLFTSRGRNYIGWSHQTFAEYLVAWYLSEIDLNPERILKILCIPSNEKIIPQLYETAAWLSELNSAFSSLILQIEPEVVLESDVLIAPGTDKAKLVEQLLNLLELNLIFVERWRIRERCSKLDHPNLAGQLSLYIENQAIGEDARTFAIDTAIACKLQSLQEVLIARALDISEKITIRIAAAFAIDEIANRKIRQKLKPLAFGMLGEDPDDQLKGIALRALWPEDITAEELFSVLNQPKNPNLIGAYSIFISEKLANSFTEDDLPHALKWILNQGKVSKLDYTWQRFIDAIMMRAWSLLEKPVILDCFAQTVWILLKQHDYIFDNCRNKEASKSLVEDINKRQMLICAIIPLVKNPKAEVYFLVFHERFLYEDDIPWLLEMLSMNSNAEHQEVIAYLISRLIHYQIKPKTLNAILEVCGIEAKSRNLKLAEALGWLVNPVLIDSEEAGECRKNYALQKEFEERRKFVPIVPSPGERILQTLTDIESGKYNYWPQLIFNLSLTLEGKADWSNDKILEQPGWKSASIETKQRIIGAATLYIENCELDLEELFNDQGRYRLDITAAYPALIMLYRTSKNYFDKISSDIWKKLAPLIIVYPFISEEYKENYSLFLQMSYQTNPEVVLESIEKKINIDLKRANSVFILDSIELIWDDKIANFLLKKIQEPNVSIRAFKDFLRLLLKKKESDAKDFSLNLITNMLKNKVKEDKDKAVIAASNLIEYLADDIWLQIWPILQSDVEFGRAVISTLVNTTLSGIAPIVCLEEYQIADVYIWLEQQFPEHDDPHRVGAYFLDTHDRIRLFRNGCITYLREKGTQAACDALKKIVSLFPEKQWLKNVHYDACKITRATTWVPLKPSEIIRFTSESSIHLVRTEHELVEVVISSLEQIQKKLKGKNSPVHGLWEEKSACPKSEIRLSEFIVRELEQQLKTNNIILNREIEIKNISGKGTGDRIDILVEALAIKKEKEMDRLAVVIEIKGCWNTGLMTDMEEQLKNKYLEIFNCKYGIYLIGWYYCGRWDEEITSPSKKKCKKTIKGMSLAELQNVFNIQAKNLSSSEVTIKSYILDVTY